MSYRFRSRSTGDVLMLDQAGTLLLQAMGIRPAAQGIIQPLAMPAAIRAVEAAIAQDESAGSMPESALREAPAHDDNEVVSLRQRAWPLVDMMRQAHAADEAIVWGV